MRTRKRWLISELISDGLARSDISKFGENAGQTRKGTPKMSRVSTQRDDLDSGLRDVTTKLFKRFVQRRY